MKVVMIILLFQQVKIADEMRFCTCWNNKMIITTFIVLFIIRVFMKVIFTTSKTPFLEVHNSIKEISLKTSCPRTFCPSGFAPSTVTITLTLTKLSVVECHWDKISKTQGSGVGSWPPLLFNPHLFENVPQII